MQITYNYGCTAAAFNITSGQSNLTTDRIAAAANGSIVFARWRLYALLWAHWRHLANTTKRVLPLAHLSPQPKRQIDRFSRF